MIILKQSISKKLREALARNYRATTEFDWYLLVHLLYQTHTDRKIRLSDELLGLCAGKVSKSFRGAALLAKFNNNVLPFLTESPMEIKSQGGGKDKNFWTKKVASFRTPRYLASEIVWGPEIETEFLSRNKGERVEVATGKKWTNKKQRTNENKIVSLLRFNGVPKHYLASSLKDYLNNLAPSTFNEIKKNMPQAYELALTCKQPEKVKSALEAIEFECCRDVYNISEFSARLFTIGDSICYLPSKIRPILAPKWHEVDLRSAQLAIVAKVWGTSSVETFLEEGRSWWKYLFLEMGWEFDEEDKRFLKDLTYALVFGASKPTLYREAEESGRAKGDVRKFLKIPMVKTIWNKRKIILKEIRLAGGCLDAFGNWIQYQYKAKGHSNRSILAQVAQSYEFSLMLDVIDFFLKTEDCKLTLWQHDGFSFSCRPAWREWIEKRLVYLVAQRAKQLGILTSLEVKARVPIKTELLRDTLPTSTSITSPTLSTLVTSSTTSSHTSTTSVESRHKKCSKSVVNGTAPN